MKQESMKRWGPGFQNPATLVVERFNQFQNQFFHLGQKNHPLIKIK